MSELTEALARAAPAQLDDLGGEWDREILGACESFGKVSKFRQASTRAAIDSQRGSVLLGWAEATASAAVRFHDERWAVGGLIGLSLVTGDDPREVLNVYSLLGRASQLIGAGDAPLERARLATDEVGASFLRALPSLMAQVTPATHSEFDGIDGFEFRRREQWDPEVELADFADPE